MLGKGRPLRGPGACSAICVGKPAVGTSCDGNHIDVEDQGTIGVYAAVSEEWAYIHPPVLWVAVFSMEKED